VLAHLSTMSQGQYDLPSGRGVKKGDVWY